MDIGEVTAETFAGREGETFSIAFADAVVELRLAAIERAPGHWGRSDRREPFSIALTGPRAPVLPQQIWPLDHEELGRLELVLVPLGEQDGLMRYEAVFT